MYPQISDLLKAGLDPTWEHDHTFRACRLEHPKFRQGILLIGAPVLYVPFGSTLNAKSEGLQNIITQV